MTRPFDKFSFAETVEKYTEGVAYVGEQGTIVDCNETYRRITGMGTGPLSRFDSLVHPSHLKAWKAGLTAFRSDPPRSRRLILLINGSGSSDRWVRLGLFPLSDIGQSGFLILLSDITAQKRLETNLIQARDQAERAARSRGEFLANTSHEIRTPIHTILSSAELLTDTVLDQEQGEYVGGIQFAAEVLLTLINDILDFSKIEAGQLRLERTEFELSDMLEGAMDMVTLEAHKKNVDIGLYLDPTVPATVYGDPIRLRQVVVNLTNNGVKFTNAGQVTLDVETVAVNQDVARLKFTVTDSGVGIPLERQENLFDAFHQADSSTTRRYGGTGLGLFISQSIVTQMGGSIFFKSEPGVGSTFFFEIELDRADDADAVPSPSVGPFENCRVLIVDNNDAIRDRLGRTLKSWGLAVDEAGGAEEALFLIKSANSPGYQLIFVDQTMPHIDGWQFASKLHSNNQIDPPPMILMSMKGGRGTVEAKMKLLGWFKSYLTKPLRYWELASTVSRLLGEDLDLEEPAEMEEAGSEPKQSPPSGRKILIAEDHEVNRRLLQIILERNGHQVLLAANGAEAFDIAVRENPDLVFMDCQMPVINGYEAATNLRNSGYGGPIVAVTASAAREERAACLQSGMNDLVRKPFQQADVLMMIERYVGIGAVLAKSSAATKESNPNEESPPSGTGQPQTGFDEFAASEGFLNLPVFNFDAAVKTFLGNTEIVRSLLKPHIEAMEEQVESIRAATESRDWEELRIAAHTIKGSCYNLDMMRCGEAAAGLEAAAKTKDTDRAQQGLAILDRELPPLKAAVEEALAS